MRQREETNAAMQHGSETRATREETALSAVLRLHKCVNDAGGHQKETDHDVDLEKCNVQFQQILRVR